MTFYDFNTCSPHKEHTFKILDMGLIAAYLRNFGYKTIGGCRQTLKIPYILGKVSACIACSSGHGFQSSLDLFSQSVLCRAVDNLYFVLCVKHFEVCSLELRSGIKVKIQHMVFFLELTKRFPL